MGKVGTFVFDRWWPWRLGKVAWVGRTRIRVRWLDGEVWSYDRAHQKFLQVVT